MRLTQEEFEDQMNNEMEDIELDKLAEQQEQQMQNQSDYQEGYGINDAEQSFNQHTFLANSIEFDEPEKVTFLGESELGRPLFNVRFLLDIEDISKYYIDDMAKEYKCTNEIANYFRAKIANICSSGMSNKGFIQNLNVTRKMDSTKKRLKNLNLEKGGDK